MRSILLAALLSACGSASKPHPTTPAPVAKAPPPRSTSEDGRACIGAGEPMVSTHGEVGFSSMLAVGPGLWSMLKDDPEVLALHTRGMTAIPDRQGGVRASFDMATFCGHDTVASLIATPRFHDVVVVMMTSPDGVAAATPEERQLFYAQTPYELDGLQLVVFKKGDHRLLVVAKGAGEVIWFEMLDLWARMYGALPPEPQ